MRRRSATSTALLSAVWHDDKEFFAAITDKQIIFADMFLCKGCEQFKEFVACWMPVFVIEFLEIIDIQHDHRYASIIFPAIFCDP